MIYPFSVCLYIYSPSVRKPQHWSHAVNLMLRSPEVEASRWLRNLIWCMGRIWNYEKSLFKEPLGTPGHFMFQYVYLYLYTHVHMPKRSHVCESRLNVYLVIWLIRYVVKSCPVKKMTPWFTLHPIIHSFPLSMSWCYLLYPSPSTLQVNVLVWYPYSESLDFTDCKIRMSIDEIYSNWYIQKNRHHFLWGGYIGHTVKCGGAINKVTGSTFAQWSKTCS